MTKSEEKKARIKGCVFYLTLGTAIILLVAGFFLPPMGVIDPSVIQAAGILGGFSVIGQLPSIIESAKTVKLSSGASSIEVTGHDKKEN